MYLNQFGAQPVIRITFELQIVCDHFVQVGLFIICTSNFQIVLDLFLCDFLHYLPPFFPFWIFVRQGLVQCLEQRIIQQQFPKLLQLIIHAGSLRSFTRHLVKCLRLTFQFLNLYLELMGTILHLYVELYQLLSLLYTCIFQIHKNSLLLNIK